MDLYSRGSFYTVSWLLFLGWVVVPVLMSVPSRPLPLILAVLTLGTGVTLCVIGVRTVRQALDHYMERAPEPRRQLALCAGLMGLMMAATAAFQAATGLKDGTAQMAMLFAPVPFAVPFAMVVPVRIFFLAYVAITAFGTGLLAAAGERGVDLVVVAPIMLAGCLMSLFIGRPGAWSLSLMWELERARDTEARLAVAEERLRFGRDLHDVMGRNLAVIALKSELAVQMARRGRPEAVDHMVEVQRLAQDSQREVREVVRGYREADLRVELAGAEGVLKAAGVKCTVTGGNLPELPGKVQSALGWVVREATTNVLRHGDAKRCAIALSLSGPADGRDRHVVLTVENDGAPPGLPGTAGSGLPGLRERLKALDGKLEAAPGERGTFRLRAEVPLGEVEV